MEKTNTETNRTPVDRLAAPGAGYTINRHRPTTALTLSEARDVAARLTSAQNALPKWLGSHRFKVVSRAGSPELPACYAVEVFNVVLEREYREGFIV